MSSAEGLRVAIAGGSIGGLCAGLALRGVGCDVNIYERASGPMISRGAGIVVQHELLRILSKHDAADLRTTSCSHRRYLRPDGGSERNMSMAQDFTSWEAIYRSLQSAFPDEHYHLDSDVAGFDESGDSIDIHLGDGSKHSADALVLADGSRSQNRAQLLPNAKATYAGYVAWRGTIAESDVDPELVRFYDNCFTFCDARSGAHALCYLIPGDDAAVDPGKRRLNWVWYVNVHEGADLDRLLASRSGERRTGSVGEGEVPDDVVEEMHAAASKELHPRFAELIRATPSPFLQSIVDLEVPQMAFGQACLLGDAAFVVRPHTAGASAKAAADAMALARALENSGDRVTEGLKDYERQRVPAGRSMMSYGMRLGERSAAAR